MFNTGGEQTAQSQGTIAVPPLAGLEISDTSMRRQYNILGYQDETLTVYIGQIGASILIDTDLVITLPQGQFLTQPKTQCFRLFKGDQQLNCVINENQITLKNVCD